MTSILVRPKRRSLVLMLAATALVAICFCVTSGAQDRPAGTQPTADKKEPPATAPAAEADKDAASSYVTRLYGIRDLVSEIPNYDSAPDLMTDEIGYGTSGPGGEPEVPGVSNLAVFESKHASDKTRDERVENLIELLANTVAPETWRANGGMYGTAKEYAGNLIVTQTVESHRMIAMLLAQLREVRSTCVRVRAHWILTDRNHLEKVLKPAVMPQTAPATQPANSFAPNVRVRHAAHPLLVASEADLSALPGALAHFRAETIGLDGHRFAAVAVRHQTAGGLAKLDLKGNHVKASVEGNSSLGGLVLDVSPTLSEDGSTALICIRGQWKAATLALDGTTTTVEASATTRPATLPAGGESAATGRASGAAVRRNSRITDLRTTVRIPVGQMVLIGGSTVDATIPPADQSASTRPAAASPPQLYLFIEVTAD